LNTYQVSEANIIGLCSSTQNETWIEVYREDNVKKKWHSFHSIFNYYFNIAYPKARRNLVSASKAPWINKEVLKVRTKLKKLYDHYMQSKIQVDKDINKT
jgi:hypothetical protein